MRRGPAATACPSCGRPAADGDHSRCAFDPPRLCPSCGRRLVVQVFPLSYQARCLVCDREPAEQG